MGRAPGSARARVRGLVRDRLEPGRIVLWVPGDEGGHAFEGGELRYSTPVPVAPGTGVPVDDPEAAHDRQHYRAGGPSGQQQLSYRRFFAVASLPGSGWRIGGVRATDARVAPGRPTAGGLRVDHPDGLVDPVGTCAGCARGPGRLDHGREDPRSRASGCRRLAGRAPPATTRSRGQRAVRRPRPRGEPDRAHQRLTGTSRLSPTTSRRASGWWSTTLLPAEVGGWRRWRPSVPSDAAEAVAEVAVAFEVYRSYLPDGVARPRRGAGTGRAAPAAAGVRRWRHFSPRCTTPEDELARRMQQLSGATMAKGVEDTAFYRYARFVALNEVGADPAQFGIGLEDFHALQLSPAAQPRVDDRRCRPTTPSAARTSGPGWRCWRRSATVGAFAEAFLDAPRMPTRLRLLPGADPGRGRSGGAGAAARVRREGHAGGQRRHHLDLDRRGVRGGGARGGRPRLRRPAAAGRLGRLLALVEQPGWSNALGQKLVQLTMPGTPDVYQGTELWEDSLVDPDNRRPVDFAAAGCSPSTGLRRSTHRGRPSSGSPGRPSARRDRPSCSPLHAGVSGSGRRHPSPSTGAAR